MEYNVKIVRCSCILSVIGYYIISSVDKVVTLSDYCKTQGIRNYEKGVLLINREMKS